ncbi:hypothetical protein ILYODFUR_011997, partial [Ilyodon furcidens]
DVAEDSMLAQVSQRKLVCSQHVEPPARVMEILRNYALCMDNQEQFKRRQEHLPPQTKNKKK